jgi:hypothetical protein
VHWPRRAQVAATGGLDAAETPTLCARMRRATGHRPSAAELNRIEGPNVINRVGSCALGELLKDSFMYRPGESRSTGSVAVSWVLADHDLPLCRRPVRRRVTAARTIGRPPKETQWAGEKGCGSSFWLQRVARCAHSWPRYAGHVPGPDPLQRVPRRLRLRHRHPGLRNGRVDRCPEHRGLPGHGRLAAGLLQRRPPRVPGAMAIGGLPGELGQQRHLKRDNSPPRRCVRMRRAR